MGVTKIQSDTRQYLFKIILKNSRGGVLLRVPGYIPIEALEFVRIPKNPFTQGVLYFARMGLGGLWQGVGTPCYRFLGSCWGVV